MLAEDMGTTFRVVIGRREAHEVNAAYPTLGLPEAHHTYFRFDRLRGELVDTNAPIHQGNHTPLMSLVSVAREFGEEALGL